MLRTKRPAPKPDTIWAIPDALWPALEDIPDAFYPPAATGRPRADFRRALDGIIYRMRSGVQWNRSPPEFGSDATVHRRFQRLAADGVSTRLRAVLAEACDEWGGVRWEWQSANAVIAKARSGGSSWARTRPTGATRAPGGVC